MDFELDLDLKENPCIYTIFGILEFSNIYIYIVHLIRICKETGGILMNEKATLLDKMSPFFEVIVILSVLWTGYLYLKHKKYAFYIYYIQFLPRLIYKIPTLGILFHLEHIIPDHGAVNLVKVSCIILDLVRLIFTIKIHYNNQTYV